MPSNAPLTVKDGKATPADHIFAPVRIDAQNRALFAESIAGSLIGRPTLSYLITGGANGSAYKAQLQINVPKVETVTDGSGTREVVRHTAIAKAELLLPATTSVQERKDARVLLANALTHTVLGPAFDNVESFW